MFEYAAVCYFCRIIQTYNNIFLAIRLLIHQDFSLLNMH